MTHTITHHTCWTPGTVSDPEVTKPWQSAPLRACGRLGRVCHISGIRRILCLSFTAFPKLSISGDVSSVWTHDWPVSAAESPDAPVVPVSPRSSRCGIVGGPWALQVSGVPPPPLVPGGAIPAALGSCAHLGAPRRLLGLRPRKNRRATSGLPSFSSRSSLWCHTSCPLCPCSPRSGSVPPT